MANRIDNINQSIVSLHESERVTKEVLRGLSRDVLTQLYEDGDIQYVNRVTAVLTPANRKVWILFMQAFSGHQHTEETGSFHKKDKTLVKTEDGELPMWKVKQANGLAEMTDPSWSIWPWVDREVKMEAKEFTLDKVTKGVESYMKKCSKNGIKQADLVRAIFAAGIDLSAVMVVLDEMTLEALEGEHQPVEVNN